MSFIRALLFEHLWGGDNGNIEKMQTSLVIFIWLMIANVGLIIAEFLCRV